MTKGPQALMVKPATVLPEIVYITVILRFLYASNCSLNRLNLWLLFFRWFPNGKTFACKKTTRSNYSKGFGIFSEFCVLDLIHFPLNLRNTETIKILLCENEQKPKPHSWKPKSLELEPCSWKGELRSRSCVIFTRALQPWNNPHSRIMYTVHTLPLLIWSWKGVLSIFRNVKQRFFFQKYKIETLMKYMANCNLPAKCIGAMNVSPLTS